MDLSIVRNPSIVSTKTRPAAISALKLLAASPACRIDFEKIGVRPR